MANFKLLKTPAKPRLPKKPAQSAGLQTKQAWLRRVQDMKAKYEAKLRAVKHENERRKARNEASKKASTVIAGIGDIMEVRPGSFSAKIVRARRSGSSSVSGVKKKRTVKAAKRKPAAKKKATKRRR